MNKKGRQQREKRSSNQDNADVPDWVPPFTTSLDFGIPGENIVGIQYEEGSGKWIAVNRSKDGTLHIGVANTEPLARRSAGLRALAASEERAELAPTSDKYVRIDHNRQEFSELISTLNALVEAIRENNDYAVSNPEDQTRRVSEIESAKELIKNPGAVGITILISTLTYLSLKFSDNLIGKLADTAFDLLQKIIGG